MYQGFDLHEHRNCPICKEEYNIQGGCKCNNYTFGSCLTEVGTYTGRIVFENNSEVNISSILPIPSRKAPMPKCKPHRVDYDHVKNIKHLILRYNNKQDTLHVNQSEYDEGLNDGLLTAIHDLEYILKEMEV